MDWEHQFQMVAKYIGRMTTLEMFIPYDRLKSPFNLPKAYWRLQFSDKGYAGCKKSCAPLTSGVTAISETLRAGKDPAKLHCLPVPVEGAAGFHKEGKQPSLMNRSRMWRSCRLKRSGY